MRAILDVNVIIALFDPDHAFHERAHAWWAANDAAGWASCPITENGVVRIMSNPGYSASTRFTPGQLIEQLRTFTKQTDHQFWPDDVSIRDEAVVLADYLHSSRQVTDIYLLALATKRAGRLATFDQSIPLSALTAAGPMNLAVI